MLVIWCRVKVSLCVCESNMCSVEKKRYFYSVSLYSSTTVLVDLRWLCIYREILRCVEKKNVFVMCTAYLTCDVTMCSLLKACINCDMFHG
jgi:hypothetical protein